ncbi:NAD(P)/FAD-dependent oxidoreductase [Pimelobacter simplex]|uniref:NAD(P)/FAD-dependent oxidoreductase n=1 Tax=Nocardioides simplex TaxID=2045 RepID=UPI00214FD5A3|nr:NAD(P)/FAD-dependent oxidoreductase [Pimelobacter simplex]UUW91297.1 NAD(P)/FAD-dependent oxidoreductase [Pimelobacter simplex]UUW95125.1 NAD(P)/FAD-dependent oxidoreductase [Pimelobacter simplex]
MNAAQPSERYDVAVVGAGSAGLQAAQTLGRMHQRAVVLGTDRYRNDPATHMHNFLGHDGEPPAELRVAARKDAEQYDDVEFRDVEVLRVSGELGDFTLDLADGTHLRATRVLLATGVTDHLPDVPGVAEQFGDLVAHCPFCHGHEFAGRTVGILGAGPQAAHFAGMLAPIAGDLVVLADGADLDEATTAALARVGARVVGEPVRAVRRTEVGLAVDLGDDTSLDLGGLFVKTEWTQATPFAEQLGLDVTELGAVVVDVLGRTSVPGVFAAGDLAAPAGLPMPMASVLIAAAAGMAAAAGCVADAAVARTGH